MEKIYQELIAIFQHFNSQINLSSIRNPEDIYLKHILDSLELNKIFTIQPGSQVIDIGTGGGFPLLPLGISNPQASFLGLDSINKKVKVVNQMILKLYISNAQVIWSRAEDYKGNFDILTARAVGLVDKILKYSYHLVKPGGKFILYKMYSQDEYSKLEKIILHKNLQLIQKYHYKLCDNDIDRVIYILQKSHK